MRRFLEICVVVALVATACSGGGATTTSVASPEATTSPTTLPVTTSTTIPPTTTVTTTTTTTPPLLDDVWIARSDGGVVSIEALDGGERFELAVDARLDKLHGVFSDGSGGIIAAFTTSDGGLVMWLPADAISPVVDEFFLSDLDFGPSYGYRPFGVAHIGGDVGLTFLAKHQTSASRTGTVTRIEWTTRFVFLPMGGNEPVSLYDAPGWALWDDELGDLGFNQGLIAATAGGDRLALLFEDEELCRRFTVVDRESGEELSLDLDFGSSTDIGGCPATPDDPHLSPDGSVLIGAVTDPQLPPQSWRVVAWDLDTGMRLGSTAEPGVNPIWIADGNLAVLTIFDEEHRGSYVLFRVEGDRVVTTDRVGDWQWFVGLGTGPILLAPDASLVVAEPWTDCSAAGASIRTQSGLPEPVAATRDAIAAAASSCDLSLLASIGVPYLVFTNEHLSCGYRSNPSIIDASPVPLWYEGDIEVAELATLVDTLRVPYTVDGDIYVWAHATGYRIEIDMTGAWVFNGRTWPMSGCH
jgi:hypothetical protein